MSGDSYYLGETVNMNGGRGNVGIDKRQVVAAEPSAVSPALQSAVEELRQKVEELRSRVSPASAQTIDDSLADISADEGVPSQDRHRALMTIAGIAGMVGAVGQPVADAIKQILELLGVQ